MTMTQSEIEKMRAQVEELEIQIEAAKREKAKAEREAARAKEKAENEAHYERMYEEIGLPLAGLNEVQHSIVYAQAWEQGHSSGYEEVEGHYGEFAEMARRLLAAQ